MKSKSLYVVSLTHIKSNIANHLDILGKTLGIQMSVFGNFSNVGRFNLETETLISNFCDMYYLHNSVKDPTCCENSKNPPCIDLILTNSFMKTQTSETCSSDFHIFTFTILKMHFEKSEPNIVVYRDYKHFCDERFRLDFLSEIEKYYDCSLNGFHSFTSILDKTSSYY